jgi:hypothetical protein
VYTKARTTEPVLILVTIVVIGYAGRRQIAALEIPSGTKF